MRFFILSLCFACAFTLNTTAQIDSLNFYVNENLSPAAKNESSFCAIAVKNLKTDTVWTVTIKYLNNDTVALRGFFYDTSFSKPEGHVAMYNNNGIKTTEGQYHNAKQNGLWLGWTDGGNIMDSSYFFNDVLIANTHYNYNGDGKIASRLYSNNNTKEKALYIYGDSGLTSETHYVNGYDYQVFKAYYPNGILQHEFIEKKQKISDEKFYARDGSEISKKQYEQILKEIKSNEPKFIQPEFPGGMNSFMNYINSALRRNNSLQDEIAYVKQISIIFFLDENGKPNNIKLPPGESMEFTKAITDAMNSMPRWKMNGLKSYGPLQRTIKFIL